MSEIVDEKEALRMAKHILVEAKHILVEEQYKLVGTMQRSINTILAAQYNAGMDKALSFKGSLAKRTEEALLLQAESRTFQSQCDFPDMIDLGALVEELFNKALSDRTEYETHLLQEESERLTQRSIEIEAFNARNLLS